MSNIITFTSSESHFSSQELLNTAIANVEARDIPLTMTSLEIAELVDVRHDNVRVSIERLADRGVITLPSMQEKPTAGRPIKEYVFSGEQGKLDTYTVVAQLSPEFTARLVVRWQELEATLRDPARFLRDIGVSNALLLQNIEKVIALEAKLEEAEPKAQSWEEFVNSEGLYCLQNAGRALGFRPKLFIYWLQDKYLHRQGGILVPYQPFIQRGLFTVKSTTYSDGKKSKPQTYITPKGLEHLSNKVPQELKAAA